MNTDPDIAQVRSANPLESVAAEYIPLRRQATRYLGSCPFHTERSPSFTIWTDIQAFRCFGCGAAGDVFRFIQLIESIPFPDALRRLADRAGITLGERTKYERRDQARARNDAAAIAEEATIFWRGIRLALCHQESQLAKAERAGSRYALANPDHDLTVLAIHAIDISLARVRRNIELIDRSPGKRLAAAYLQFRSPELVHTLRDSARDAEAVTDLITHIIGLSQ